MDFRPLTSENSDFLPEEPLGENLLPGEETLRVWRPKSRVVVLGRSQKAEQEIFLERTREDSVPVFQRHGGGGCVVLDSHSVCIGLRYERKGSLNVSRFLDRSTEGMQRFLRETYGLETEAGENNDLLVEGKKFLGCSLYMPREYSLYLAVLLMEREAMPAIKRYLRMPSKQPAHRRSRSHEDFLTPLLEHIDSDTDSFMADLRRFMTETDWTSF